MNKRVVLSAILSLVLCFSMIAGATYALFTSEHKTNIAVTSGKVDVVASIENLELYSPAGILADGTISDATNVAANGVFANGGTVVLDGAKLTLDKVTPGDRVNFRIRITNNSNVLAQYRTVIRVYEDNGLVDGLTMQIGDSYDGTTKYTEWKPLQITEDVEILECFVELPTTAGNKYQDKTCTIIFTVEAVQGNASTDNNVAKIGDTGYATLEGAINAVQSNETIELVLPGTYAPFTIPNGKTNVTVKGIVGKTKAESTVIRTTATDNIRTYGDGTTLDALWIESPVAYNNGAWSMVGGSISPYYNTNSGYVAKDITVTNCRLDGQNAEGGFAILYCSTGLTFTNNIVENYGVGVYVMNDGTVADGFTITGNTFNNVEDPFNGYWGGQATDANKPVVFANNTVTGNETAYVTIWDYAQNTAGADYSAFSDVQVYGNNGNIVYCLTHFNYTAATKHTVTPGTGTQAIKYLSKVKFELPENAANTNYEIQNADGSAWSNRTGNNTLDTSAFVYTLATGNYVLVDKTTGVKYAFTVADPDTTQQVVKLDTVAINTAADLANFSEQVNSGNTFAGKTVKLTANIDMTNVAYTPAGSVNSYPSVTFAGTFDGQGYTISNLVTSAFADGGVASAGLFGSLTGKVMNVNIDKATITSSHYAGGIVGYTSNETKGGMVISNCKVTNSTIVSAPEMLPDGTYDNGDKVGGIAGYIANNDTINGCTVENTTVRGYRDIGGIVGYAHGVVTNNTVVNVTVSVDKAHNYKNYTTDDEYDCNPVIGEYTKNTVQNGNKVNGVVEEVVVAPATFEELMAAFETAASANTDMVINLTRDFDAENKWEAFSPKGYSGVKKLTINGNGHTISNLNQPLVIGAFAGDGVVTINDLTIQDAKISNARYNGLGLGAFVAYSDASGGVALNNCKLINSTVECTDGYAGGLIGYASSAVTISGCTVSGCTIIGGGSTGAIAGQFAAPATVSGCTISNNKISYANGDEVNTDGWRVGVIVGTVNGGAVAFETIETKDNTLAQGTVTPATHSNLYGRNVGNQQLTLDGSAI